MDRDQSKLQSLSESLQKIQDDLQSTISVRQTLESQSAENTAVQKEFRTLSDGSNIYKLVGPILLRQDKLEATNAVDGRLDFIGKEITRTETKIKGLQGEAEKLRMEIIGIQQQAQMAAQGQPTG